MKSDLYCNRRPNLEFEFEMTMTNGFGMENRPGQKGIEWSPKYRFQRYDLSLKWSHHFYNLPRLNYCAMSNLLQDLTTKVIRKVFMIFAAAAAGRLVNGRLGRLAIGLNCVRNDCLKTISSTYNCICKVPLAAPIFIDQ